MSSKKIDLTGQRFGRLVAHKKVPPPDHVKDKSKSYWLCNCDCGKEKTVYQYHLTSGAILSCGCLQKEAISEFNAKTKKKHNEYDLENENYGIGYDLNGRPFIFDKEDFDKIKNYCWHFTPGNYVVTEAGDSTIYIHKLIMDDSDYVGDHINGDTTDNRKCNLRKTTFQENSMNKKLHNNNTSGVSGVCYNKRNNNWTVRIGYKMKRIWIGSYDNYEDAVIARKKAEEKYFGEFSRAKAEEIIENNKKNMEDI